MWVLVRGLQLYTWGSGYHGQLALGTRQVQPTPAIVSKLLTTQQLLRKVWFGSHHCAAVTTDGELYTWGSNRTGCLGRKLPGTAVPRAMRGNGPREDCSRWNDYRRPRSGFGCVHGIARRGSSICSVIAEVYRLETTVSAVICATFPAQTSRTHHRLRHQRLRRWRTSSKALYVLRPASDGSACCSPAFHWSGQMKSNSLPIQATWEGSGCWWMALAEACLGRWRAGKSSRWWRPTLTKAQ